MASYSPCTVEIAVYFTPGNSTKLCSTQYTAPTATQYTAHQEPLVFS